MATEQLYKESQYFTTTLNVGGGINNSQTTGIIISSVSGLESISEPGIALLSYTDPLLTANAEWITYTSINGSNELQGVTRGSEGFSAKSHANGVTVAFPHSKSHINNVVNSLRTGWVGSKYTWVYASSSTFTIAGVDVTSTYRKGTKLRMKQGGAYKYFYVINSAFSTDTTVTVVGDSGGTIANSSITDNYYSYASMPDGFTDGFTWTINYSGWTGNPVHVAKFWLDGRRCFVNIENVSVGTSSATTKTFTLPIVVASDFANVAGLAYDNGSDQANPAYFTGTASSNVCTIYKTLAAAAWTASGGCTFKVQFTYFI